MIKKLIFFVLSSFLVFSATMYYRLGAYKKVEIHVEERPAMYLLYKEHFGAYHKISEVISAVESWARTHRVPCEKTFGEYLDDPRNVEERRLRSIGGCLFNEPLKESSPFLSKTLPMQRFIVARFTGAPSLGPIKVYPKVEEYMKTNKILAPSSIFEIYEFSDPKNPITEYLFSWPK